MRRFDAKWAIVLVGFLALSLAFSGRAMLSLAMPEWIAEFEKLQSAAPAVSASLPLSVLPFVASSCALPTASWRSCTSSSFSPASSA